MLLGLIERTSEPGAPRSAEAAVHAPRAARRAVSRSGQRSGKYFANLYGWGTPGFDGVTLFDALGRFLDTFQFPFDILVVPGQPAIIEAYLLALQTNPATSPPGLLAQIPAFQRRRTTTDVRTRVAVLADGVRQRAVCGRRRERTITLPFDVDVRPPTGQRHVDVVVGVKGEDTANPIVLLGQAGGTPLEATLVSASAGFSAEWNSPTAPRARRAARRNGGEGRGKLVVDLSKGDGFIQSIASGGRIESTVEFKARWQPEHRAGL